MGLAATKRRLNNAAETIGELRAEIASLRADLEEARKVLERYAKEKELKHNWINTDPQWAVDYLKVHPTSQEPHP